VEVLLELCRQVPGLQVDGDVVRAAPPISCDSVLSAKEKQVLDLLARSGGLMRRPSFVSACLKKGMNRSSLYGLLEHSPVIASISPGVVGPVGAETALGTFERPDRSQPLDRHPRNCDNAVERRPLRRRKYRRGR
jgi:hypothetical protein